MNTYKRKTVEEIKSTKGTTPLVCLTAYTAPMANIIDDHADIILVGDSLGMVVYGMESTLGVTIDMMCNHGKAVVKASEKALVVVDMPFATYQKSKEQAFENAAKVIAETGCGAVKLEGGEEMAETIEFLAERGIPVMGHVGLKPQSFNVSGYRYQGRTDDDRQKILNDSIAVEKAGAFAIVLESVTESLARDITNKLVIPTIGIGASDSCDGQVLVTEDMVGMFDRVPKFVKKYANIKADIENAVEQFSVDVREKKFPENEHCFDIKDISTKNNKNSA